jgi:membrane protease YdiL (CAAX protease family)
MRARWQAILAYVGVAYGWTWITVLPLLATRRGWWAVSWPAWWQVVGAFGPAFAAWIVSRRFPSSGPGEAPPRTRPGWIAFSVASPPLALLAGILYCAVMAEPGPDLTVLLDSPKTATWRGVWDLVVIQALCQALGEEPGWRGFLLPRLREFWSPLRSTLAIFPIWLCWHLPFFLGRPDAGWPQWLGFSAGILAAAVWLTVVREKTRRTSMAVTWHTASNVSRGIALAISGSVFAAFGSVTLLGACLLAVLLWREAGNARPAATGL